MNIAESPETIFEKLLARAPISTPDLKGLPSEGSRNTFLTQIAGSLRNKGVDEEGLNRALLTINTSFEVPLADQEVAGIAHSIAQYDEALRVTERHLSERWARSFADEFRYSPAMGWLRYDGTRWKTAGAELHAQERGKELAALVFAEADSMGFRTEDARKGMRKAVKAAQRRPFINNMVKLAASNPRVMDEEPWIDQPGLINFQNGTLELDSFSFRDHDPQDRLTKVLDYAFDSHAVCPNFDQVLADALDAKSADFVLELFGYSLLGLGNLQRVLLLIGRGRNGKTTIVEAVANAMGEYSTTVDPNSLMKGTMKSSTNNELFALKDARLVVTSELNTGQTLDAALVKRLTGGEEITARQLYTEFVSFKPTALITMVSNMAPVFDGSDFAVARRMVVVPFTNIVSDNAVDLNLPQKLKEEAPGIMNRLLEGLKRYREKGYSEPASVSRATADIVEDSNQVLQFLKDRCEHHPDARVRARELHDAYRIWCSGEGLRPMSERSFKGALERTIQCEQKRSSGGKIWCGIALRKTN